MRVVLDTNVLLSACLKPDGLEGETVAMALEGRITIFATEEVWAEYRDVLFRPKFTAVRDRAEALTAKLDGTLIRVVASERLWLAADEDDNRFLECAAAACAEYLVTGNLRHYPPIWGGIAVVNAREFQRRMAERCV